MLNINFSHISFLHVEARTTDSTVHTYPQLHWSDEWAAFNRWTRARTAQRRPKSQVKIVGCCDPSIRRAMQRARCIKTSSASDNACLTRPKANDSENGKKEREKIIESKITNLYFFFDSPLEMCTQIASLFNSSFLSSYSSLIDKLSHWLLCVISLTHFSFIWMKEKSVFPPWAQPRRRRLPTNNNSSVHRAHPSVQRAKELHRVSLEAKQFSLKRNCNRRERSKWHEVKMKMKFEFSQHETNQRRQPLKGECRSLVRWTQHKTQVAVIFTTETQRDFRVDWTCCCPPP